MAGPLITPLNARLFAEKSTIARRAAKERAKQIIHALETVPIPTPLSERAITVERQIDELDARLSKVKDAKDIDALVRAKHKLLECWSLLTGHPRPGIRKTGRTAAPVFVAPIPQGAPVAAPQISPAPQPVVLPLPQLKDNTLIQSEVVED
jgi:hypothetical protein